MRILLLANTDWYLYNFRLALAKALRARGDEILLLAPPGRYVERLETEGFRWIPIALSRRGVNPAVELATVMRLARLYRRERPDLVHHFTIKCVLYGSLAARLAGVPRVVNAITGRGFVFMDRSWRARMMRFAATNLYRTALRKSQVIFQNPEDRSAFVGAGLVTEGAIHLIRGSGVDIARFTPNIRPSGHNVRVLFASRLLRAKGIGEFVEAARIVAVRAGDAVRFVVAGEPDPGNPDTVRDGELARWRAEGIVEFLGHRDDMPALLAESDIVVLPSYYEGTPRNLIEAAAAGLPLIATDVPGCREVVRHGCNGLLVPPRDASALAAAIVQLAGNRDLRAAMGAEARRIAVAEFSQEKVIAETLGVYERTHQVRQ